MYNRHYTLAFQLNVVFSCYTPGAVMSKTSVITGMLQLYFLWQKLS